MREQENFGRQFDSFVEKRGRQIRRSQSLSVRFAELHTRLHNLERMFDSLTTPMIKPSEEQPIYSFSIKDGYLVVLDENGERRRLSVLDSYEIDDLLTGEHRRKQLIYAGISEISQLKEAIEKGLLGRVRNLGPKYVERIKMRLDEYKREQARDK